MSKESIERFFKSVMSDMARDNAKVRVTRFEPIANNAGGKLLAPDWFKYMITGRGPGKAPPPDRMLDYVKRNPDVVAQFEQWFQKNISEKSAAYIMGQSIAKRGTRVFRGEVKGVDLLVAMENNMDDLLKGISESKALEIATSLSSKIK